MADVSLRESQEKLLNWLFPGPFNGVHVEISQRRVEGTGKWFLETPEFQEWTSGREGTQLLWGYGIRTYWHKSSFLSYKLTVDGL